MSIKQKILNTFYAHPKLATFGIAFAITIGITIVLSGLMDVSEVDAIRRSTHACPGSILTCT